MTRLALLRQWQPSRLGLKLFVVILSVNVAIAASMFLAVSYSIDRGFLDYLNQAQERRATLLADGLITRWETQGSWEWLEQSPERWPFIVRFELGQEHRDRPPRWAKRVILPYATQRAMTLSHRAAVALARVSGAGSRSIAT